MDDIFLNNVEKLDMLLWCACWNISFAISSW